MVRDVISIAIKFEKKDKPYIFGGSMKEKVG